MRLVRCIPCAALLFGLISAGWTAVAMADPTNVQAGVSPDAVLGIVATGLFMLVAGYTARTRADLRDLKTDTSALIRAAMQELAQHQQQINMLRSDILKEHPSRPEFTALRDDMHRGFAEVKDLIRERQ
jgi:hypothetical protein